MTLPSPRPRSLDEASLDHLETQFPQLFQAAVTQAYWGTLARGLSVLERTEAGLVETLPDGTSRLVKALPPREAVRLGETRRLR